MSAIAVYVTQQTVYQDKLDKAITELSNELTALKAKLKELQDSPGQITPSDQTLLDQSQARSDAALAKLQSLQDIEAPVPPALPVVSAPVPKPGTSVFDGSISGKTLTVTGVTFGVILVGQAISGSGVKPGTTITGVIVATGGPGTYTVSDDQLVGPTSITGA